MEMPTRDPVLLRTKPDKELVKQIVELEDKLDELKKVLESFGFDPNLESTRFRLERNK